MEHDTQDRGPVWGHSTHEAAEHWCGAGPTRDDAIADGRDTYGTGDAFWIVEGHWIDPVEYFIAESVIDAAKDLLYDNGPEDAEFEFTADAQEKLGAVLAAWARENVSCRFWEAVGDPERIEP